MRPGIIGGKLAAVDYFFQIAAQLARWQVERVLEQIGLGAHDIRLAAASWVGCDKPRAPL